MSSLSHSHFTLTSICSLAPSFPSFLRLARTCSHHLPPSALARRVVHHNVHLVQPTQIPINLKLYLNTQPASRRNRFCVSVCVCVGFSALPSPFLHNPATQHHLTGCENRVLTNREMAASCTDRAGRGGKHTVLAFYWI